MLKTLIIKDYALIRAAEISFGSRLNIITGETGAGKSILLDALNLLLGERASVEAISRGAQKAVVEGIFELKNNAAADTFLTQNDIEKSDELIVRREISVKGNNRCFVNDTPVNLAVLKQLGNLLVDLHGQHEHQLLLKQEYHCFYVDSYAKNDSLINAYREELKKLRDLLHEESDLISGKEKLEEKRDYLSFVLKEIDKVTPKENEDEEIEEELNVLENSERILELGHAASLKLYEDENSVHSILYSVIKDFENLNTIDNKFDLILNELRAAAAIIDEASDYIRKYTSSIDMDPVHLENLRDRLSAINHIKKKYSKTISELISYREEIAEELVLNTNFGMMLESVRESIREQRDKCLDLAVKIEASRKEAAVKLEEKILEQLESLGIKNGRFRISIEREHAPFEQKMSASDDSGNFRLLPDGINRVEFLISTNPGEELKSLVKVASGGEVSRVMLSLKAALAENDGVPVLVFDEVDTGVSGRIARKVGAALKNLAEYHQVIAITHLPQIAAYSQNHYIVTKSENGNETVSAITEITGEGKITEIAKLISGEEITPAALNSARELINAVNG